MDQNFQQISAFQWFSWTFAGFKEEDYEVFQDLTQNSCLGAESSDVYKQQKVFVMTSRMSSVEFIKNQSTFQQIDG